MVFTWGRGLSNACMLPVKSSDGESLQTICGRLDPEIRRHCEFELFASPLNAAVQNGLAGMIFARCLPSCIRLSETDFLQPGRFSSKWPHVELSSQTLPGCSKSTCQAPALHRWRFGSIGHNGTLRRFHDVSVQSNVERGSYPSVIDYLPVNSVVCINPPFTEVGVTVCCLSI